MNAVRGSGWAAQDAQWLCSEMEAVTVSSVHLLLAETIPEHISISGALRVLGRAAGGPGGGSWGSGRCRSRDDAAGTAKLRGTGTGRGEPGAAEPLLLERQRSPAGQWTN